MELFCCTRWYFYCISTYEFERIQLGLKWYISRWNSGRPIFFISVIFQVPVICFLLFSDLTSSDRDSEHFLRKLNRARFALARTDSIRSVSSSAKPPYRRAVSVPMHLLTKTTPPKGTHLADQNSML